MDNLYEEIDLVLAESLLKEELMLLLEGFEDGPGRQAIEAMVNNIFDSDKISDDEKGEIFASMKEDLEEILEYFLNTWDKLEPDEKIVSKAGTEAGEAQEDITDAMLDGDEERFMQMIIGEPKEGTPSVLYQKKHMQAALWALRFVRDAADATKPEDEPEDEPEETEPDEPETETSDEKEIIIPDIASGGGARFVGGLRYVGTPFDTNMRKFVEKTPLGKYSTQIVGLMRTFATLTVANRVLNSFESARLAGVMRRRVGLRRRGLAEELSQDQKNFINDSAKEFEKVLDKINELFDKQDTNTAESEMVVIISEYIETLKKQKKKVESNKETKDAYFKNNFLLEPLMRGYAKVLANYQWSDEAEEAGDGTEEAGGEPEEPTVVTEGKLTTIKVDFNELRAQSLNEGFLETFGGIIELVLGAMFGNKKLPMAFTGSEGDIHAFADTIGREKRYMDAVRRYGLDHPTTYKNRAKLGNSIKSFERETGIKWPFK
jgi:hypothetical protein